MIVASFVCRFLLWLIFRLLLACLLAYCCGLFLFVACLLVCLLLVLLSHFGLLIVCFSLASSYLLYASRLFA